MSEEMKRKEKLPLWFTPMWSTSAASVGVNTVLLSYVTYYCTDILGMSAVLIGSLLLASKLFDGVTDLIIGFIIDKTHTKWGKARPYEICIVFVWLLTALLFAAPNMGATAQAVYVFIMYTLINAIFMTCLNGAGVVYLSRAVLEEENRTKVLSGSGAIVLIFTIVFATIWPQLMAGIGTTKSGWQIMVTVVAVSMGLIGILRFVFIKEVVTEEAEKKARVEDKIQKTSLKDSLRAIAGNKYIFLIAAALLLAMIVNNMGAATTYYFKYVVGDISLQSFVALTSLTAPIVLIIYPALARKFGNTIMLRLGALFGVVGISIYRWSEPGYDRCRNRYLFCRFYSDWNDDRSLCTGMHGLWRVEKRNTGRRLAGIRHFFRNKGWKRFGFFIDRTDYGN